MTIIERMSRLKRKQEVIMPTMPIIDMYGYYFDFSLYLKKRYGCIDKSCSTLAFRENGTVKLA